MPTIIRKRTHKTNQERSAATRERLLDATIASLVESGYSETSTTDVVWRAGLTRGAQVHHFPRKTELVQASAAHLARRCREELHRESARLAGGDRAEAAINLLWSTYTGPLFFAALELLVAARTDPDLRPALVALQDEVGITIHQFCRDLFGAGAENNHALYDAIDMSIRFMDGLALSGILNDREWQSRRLETWKRLVKPLFEEAERLSRNADGDSGKAPKP